MGQLNITKTIETGDLDLTIPPTSRCYVYTANTPHLARLFTEPDLNTTTENPIDADANGQFQISYLPDGAYDLVIKNYDDTKTLAQISTNVRPMKNMGVAHEFANVRDLLDDTTLAYSDGPALRMAITNDIVGVRHGTFAYRVADAQTTDHHVTTAGGVKLFVEPHYGQNGAEFHVDALGVDTSGATDLHGALSGLLNSMQQGGTLIFGGGTYRLDSSLLINVDNITFKGQGREITTILAGSTGLNLFEGPSNAARKNISFWDLGFAGHPSFVLGSSQAIRFRAYQDIHIERCKFVGFQSGAIFAGVPASSGEDIYSDLIIRDNVIDGGGALSPFSGIHVFNTDRCLIEGNFIKRVARPIDFEMSTDSVAENVRIIGNTWENCRASDHSPTNTYIGIHFTTDTGTQQSFRNVLIDGNLSKNNAHDDGSGGSNPEFGADIHIADFNNFDPVTGAGAHNIEVRTHTCTGFASRSSDAQVAVNVQSIQKLRLGKIVCDNPQSPNITAMRLRDVPQFSFDKLTACNGPSEDWENSLLEMNSTALPMNGTRGVIVGARPALLTAFEHGNRLANGSSIVSGGNFSVQSTTANTAIDSQMIAPDTLRAGDTLQIKAQGAFAGAAASKWIGLRFNGADLGVFLLTPGANHIWQFEAELYCADASLMTHWERISWHSPGGSNIIAEGQSGAISGLDLTSQTYDLDLVAWVLDPLDEIRVRSFEMELKRAY